MRAIVVALALILVAHCAADETDVTDATGTEGTPSEVDLDTGVCGVPFDGDPTCEQLSSAIATVHAASLACSVHADCLVGGDPLCRNDGGGYPYVWSIAVDGARHACLVQAFWAAGCQGPACDWFAPIPRAACFEGTCTQLRTGCTVDAECGPGQVCLVDEDTGWPINTYCDLAP